MTRDQAAETGTPRGLGPPALGWAPPAAYTQYTESALAYLAGAGAGRTPEARLLALLAALRMRKDGTAALISEDLSPERSGLPESVLKELITTGWIDTTLPAVHAAVPGEPAARCPLPGLSGTALPAGVGKQIRKRYNGWVQRPVCHDLLTGQPVGIRLAASTSPRSAPPAAAARSANASWRPAAASPQNRSAKRSCAHCWHAAGWTNCIPTPDGTGPPRTGSPQKYATLRPAPHPPQPDPPARRSAWPAANTKRRNGPTTTTCATSTPLRCARSLPHTARKSQKPPGARQTSEEPSAPW